MGNFICQLAILFATILQTDCLEEATAHVDSSTLTLFDIDMVLIQPADPAFQIANMKKHDYKRFMNQLNREQKMELLTRISVLPGSILLEANTPSLICRLQENGFKLAALTNTVTSAQFVDDKIERLRTLGIDFIPLCDEKIDFSLLPKCNGSYPLYQSGILFSNDVPKGEVLVTFLKQLDMHPKKIVFIDDGQTNLENMQQALQEYDPSIEYTGYLYTAGTNYPAMEISQKEFDAKWEALVKSVI